MHILDITGPIEKGMWTYGPPWPEVRIEEIPQPDWLPFSVNSWKFAFAGQTGTYLQTGLHFKRGRPALIEVAVEKLVNREAVILRIPGKKDKDDAISVEDLERCNADIRPGDALLVAIGRDKKWHDADYVSGSPYYTKAAMDWIISRKPFLLGGDWARWESLENPQHIFEPFFDAGILLLAPLVNLTKVRKTRARLTVLPLKIAETAHAPARAILVEE